MRAATAVLWPVKINSLLTPVRSPAVHRAAKPAKARLFYFQSLIAERRETGGF